MKRSHLKTLKAVKEPKLKPIKPAYLNDDGKTEVEVLVNTSFEETRIAILENGVLVELLWDRRNTSLNLVGNIYKATVENVLPGINSAFLNIGYEKNAYLYITDTIEGGKKPIDEILYKGQEIMVQVVKDSISTKGMKDRKSVV